MELQDRPRSGRPATATSPGMLQRADDIIHADSALQVGNWPYSFQSAMEVQWKLLMLWDVRRYARDGFLEVSQPSTDIKGKPSICSELLERFDAEGEAFLSRIVTGDETWAHHYQPEMKRQSIEWHHPQSPRKKEVQHNSFRRKGHDHRLLGH